MLRLRPVASILLLVACGCGESSERPSPVSPPVAKSACRLETIDGVRVLTLAGTPEEMGRRHGELLGEDVRWVVRKVIHETVCADNGLHDAFIERVRVMERYLDDAWRRELRALADAAQVDYGDLVGLQLFGDVERAQLCSSFAAFGPATASGECIVGRNFDYWYPEVAKRASIVIDYRPEGALRFVTLSWAGVINGWTLLNERGIVASNNTAWSLLGNSLHGVSTCFMLRKIAERADSVEAGIRFVDETPRACATNLLIAGGNPPGAAVLEYDSRLSVARRAREGFVLATNSFLEHGQTDPWEPQSGRYAVLNGLIRGHYGRIDRTMNFIAADGVPIDSINLHSALVFPSDLTFAVAMGEVPAFQGTWRWFRMTPDGIVAVEPPESRAFEPAAPAR